MVRVQLSRRLKFASRAGNIPTPNQKLGVAVMRRRILRTLRKRRLKMLRRRRRIGGGKLQAQDFVGDKAVGADGEGVFKKRARVAPAENLQNAQDADRGDASDG